MKCKRCGEKMSVILRNGKGTPVLQKCMECGYEKHSVPKIKS